ncbi:MAG: hypothetical protein KDD60_12835, partial [Bdellovibrionales bacterium]|nr:hypothetical protein [Bdellovibrionales bacterium]
ALHDQTKSVFDAVIEVLTRINEEAYATRESIDEVKHLLLDQMNASNQIARESFSIQTLNPAVTSAKTAIATLRESPGDENGVLLAQQAAIGFFTHMRASHSLAYSARHDANIDTETFRNEVRSRFPEQLTGLVGPALQAAGLDEGFSEDLDKNGLSGIPNPYEWSQAANSLLQLRAITRSEDLPAAVEQLEGVVEDCNKVRSTVKNWITRENLEELQSCYALRVEELGRQIAEEYGAAVTARNVADPTDLRLRHRVDGWSAPFNENGEVIAPSAKIDFEPSGVRSLQRSPIMGEINFYLEELQRFGVLRIRPVHQGNRSFVYRTDIVDPRIKFGHKRSVSQTTTYLDLEFLGPGWKGIRLKSDRDDT